MSDVLNILIRHAPVGNLFTINERTNTINQGENMIKLILLIVMLLPNVVGCSSTIPKKKQRECQPECRMNRNRA
jgi:hypothetical protein